MAIKDGVFLNAFNVDRVFETMARIESERLGVKVHYVGKRLKTDGMKKEACEYEETQEIKTAADTAETESRTNQRYGTCGVSAGDYRNRLP